VRVAGNVPEERAIDLQGFDGELLQVSQRRITRAEVVDRKLDADPPQLTKLVDNFLLVGPQRGLGDLERERAGIHVEILELAVSDARARRNAEMEMQASVAERVRTGEEATDEMDWQRPFCRDFKTGFERSQERIVALESPTRPVHSDAAGEGHRKRHLDETASSFRSRGS
jgi:hypothetical protein